MYHNRDYSQNMLAFVGILLAFAVGILCERHTAFGHFLCAITLGLVSMILVFYITAWLLQSIPSKEEESIKGWEFDRHSFLPEPPSDAELQDIFPDRSIRYTPFFSRERRYEEKPETRSYLISSIWNRFKPAKNRYKR